MNTTLRQFTVREICEGFVYNELEGKGLFGLSGKELGLRPSDRELKKLNKSLRDGQLYYMVDGKPEKPYARILIRKIKHERQ